MDRRNRHGRSAPMSPALVLGGRTYQGAYAEGAKETAIAEGLALAMFPGGVPNFVDACDVWRELIVANDVDATEPFRAWAYMTGQGGFDEASGKT